MPSQGLGQVGRISPPTLNHRERSLRGETRLSLDQERDESPAHTFGAGPHVFRRAQIEGLNPFVSALVLVCAAMLGLLGALKRIQHCRFLALISVAPSPRISLAYQRGTACLRSRLDLPFPGSPYFELPRSS